MIQHLSLLLIAIQVLSFGCADNESDLYYDAEDKIIGGTVVEAPAYVGALLRTYRDRNRKLNTYSFCTATLIDDNTILTAAHCFDDLIEDIDRGKIKVCFG